jgi:hypothetical protein
MSVIVVTGGRSYADRRCVYDGLDVLHERRAVTMLVHGACKYGGADILAEDWAKENEIVYVGMPARFKTEGRPGGPRRSRRMLEFAIWISNLAHEVAPRVAFFPGNDGTRTCISIATELNLEVFDGVAVSSTKHLPDGAA